MYLKYIGPIFPCVMPPTPLAAQCGKPSLNEVFMTITQRLFLMFSLLALSLAGTSFFALTAISGFQERFEYVQDNTIPSIVDLNKSISTTNSLGVGLWRHQSITDNSKMPAAEQHIYRLLDDLKALTDYYMQHDISSDEDKRLTEVAYQNIDNVRQALPAFFPPHVIIMTKIPLVLSRMKMALARRQGKCSQIFSHR